MAFDLLTALRNSYAQPKGLTSAQYNDTINRMATLYNNMSQDLYGADVSKLSSDPTVRKTLGTMGPDIDRYLFSNGYGFLNNNSAPTVAQFNGNRPVYWDKSTNKWMVGKERFGTDQFGNLDHNVLQGYDYSPDTNIENNFIKEAFSRLADPYTYANKQYTDPNNYVSSQLAKLFGTNSNLASKYGVNLTNPIDQRTGMDQFAPTVWANGNAVSRAPQSLADMYIKAGGANDGTTGMTNVWNSSANGNMLNNSLLQALSGGTGRSDMTALNNMYSDLFGSMGFKDSALNDIVSKSLSATKYGLGLDTSDATQAPRWNMLKNTLSGAPGGGGLQDFASWVQPTTPSVTTTPTTTTTNNTGAPGNTVNVGGTGNTVDNTNSTQRPTYNFDPNLYPARTANQGFREGSRYFNEGSGGYSNNYPGLGNLFQTTPSVL